MAAEEMRTAPYVVPQAAPPQLTILEALRRQLPVAILPVILLAGAAAAIGLQRTPNYTSEARLNVGGLRLTSQSIEGYTAAVTQLAIAYSRSIDARGVARPVARELRIPLPEVVDRVSASTIQGSSVVRIFAEGTDANQTVRLADSAADSLVTYAVDLNSGRSASSLLLARFKEASRDFRKAQQKLFLTPVGSAERRKLASKVDTAGLKMRASGNLYEQSRAGQAATQLVQKLAPASTAESDRSEILRDLIVGGTIAGILIGIGLAVARANSLMRRRLEPL